MKCVCRTRCQSRNDAGKIMTFAAGDVYDFKKCPANFEPVESVSINFITAEEDELQEVTWKFEDASSAVQKAYGIKLKKGSKSDVVSQIIDARYRHVGTAPNDKVTL